MLRSLFKGADRFSFHSLFRLRFSSQRIPNPSQVKLVDTAFRDVVRQEYLDILLSDYQLKASFEAVKLLKGLKASRVVPLPTNEKDPDRNQQTKITAVTINDGDFDDDSSLDKRTIFVRSFYDELFKKLLGEKRSILMGNPGISKSWFQWYMMYRICNNIDIGPNYAGCHKPPKVVVRQTGESLLTFYFPESEVGMFTDVKSILYVLDPNVTLYLYEPRDCLKEPPFAAIRLPIMMTCSPDERRYKEFKKHGASMYHMPTWTLDELLLLGKYLRTHHKPEVDFSEAAIKERYDRFGGILRYVLPVKTETVKEAEQKQSSAISVTKPVNIFVPHANIEKVDSNKENISHFILQYKVQCNGEEGDFKNFIMVIASTYVKHKLAYDLKDEELVEYIGYLKQMFMGKPQLSETFQLVVYNALVLPNIFKWQIFKNDRWIDHEWGLSKKEKLSKGDEMVENMQPGVLYYPVDMQFPAVDFVFVKDIQKSKKKKQAYCVQVTFSSSHKKPLRVYEKLYARLGMDPQLDEMFVYIISQPKYVDGYAKDTHKKAVQGISLPNLHFSTIKQADDWNLIATFSSGSTA